MTSPELAAFDCPRCSASVEQRFYGPCSHCREDLALSQRVEPRSATAGRFEPKANVVPNQVATKD